MIKLSYQISENLKHKTNVSEREMKKRVKSALQEAIDFWHNNMLPDHFKKSAYQKYASAYNDMRRKKSGKPLVETSGLKGKVLSRIQISGTSRKVTGKMFYGFRKDLTDKQLKSKAFNLIRTKRIPFKTAVSLVQKQHAYAPVKGVPANKYFSEKILALSSAEIKKLTKIVTERIKDQLTPTGSLTKTKVIR